MSYTRPSASAADLSWVGESAYTRPLSSAADLAFAVSYIATGLTPVAFGTPAVRPTAIGFAPVAFGTPIAVYSRTEQVTGFNPVAFGVPGTSSFYQATGFGPVAFGTPGLANTVLGWKIATLGFPSLALDVVGLSPLVFGVNGVIQRNRVTGMRPVRFGTNHIAYLPTCIVTGLRPARFPNIIVPIRSIP